MIAMRVGSLSPPSMTTLHLLPPELTPYLTLTTNNPQTNNGVIMHTLHIPEKRVHTRDDRDESWKPAKHKYDHPSPASPQTHPIPHPYHPKTPPTHSPPFRRRLATVQRALTMQGVLSLSYASVTILAPNTLTSTQNTLTGYKLNIYPPWSYPHRL